MNNQITLIDLPTTESICETCIHFTELDDAFYCKFFEALLAEETLSLPCEFKENDSNLQVFHTN